MGEIRERDSHLSEALKLERLEEMNAAAAALHRVTGGLQ